LSAATGFYGKDDLGDSRSPSGLTPGSFGLNTAWPTALAGVVSIDIFKSRRQRRPIFEPAEVVKEPASIEFELVEEPVQRPGRQRAPQVEQTTIEVGTDEVLLYGNKVVVCSPKRMDDWEAKDFQRPKILFQGDPYYLSRKLPGDATRPYRYELGPWPDYLEEEPKHTLTYDEEYVNRRDTRFKKVRSVTGRQSRLTFLYPILGFCWSGFKERFLEPHGFNPLRISLFSCILAYVIFMGELISFFFLASGLLERFFGSGIQWLDYLFLLVLPIDSAVRFFQIVNGTARYPVGFLEWIVNFIRPNRE
jgi:hypothetical protein